MVLRVEDSVGDMCLNNFEKIKISNYNLNNYKIIK